MKQLLVILSFTLLSIGLFAQSTPVADFRVADATTTFGINIPVGTKVYNVADGKYWVANDAVLSTATLTTAVASFTLLNAAEQVLTTDANTVTLSNGGGSFNVAGAGINVVTTAGNTITVTGTEVQGLSYTTAPSEGTVSITGGASTVLPAATDALAGLMTGADKAKLDGITSGVGVFKVESFSEGTTGSEGQDNILAFAPKAITSVLVSLNGVELKSTQYSITQVTKLVKITIPVYQYDAVSVSYSY